MVDVGAVYHQLVDTYVASDSDDDNIRAGTSTGGITPSGSSRRSRRSGSSPKDWRVRCREILDMIWSCDDARPFREPVDTLENPGKQNHSVHRCSFGVVLL